MNAPLALGLVVATAVVCGIALWPVPAAGAARSRGAASTVPAAATPADDLGGHEGELARVVLALLPDELRARAIVGSGPGAGVMLQRSVPPGAVAVGGGLPLSAMPTLPRQLAARLLEHAARSLGASRPLAESGVAFAFAGSRTAGAAFYLRLHGPDFVVEWLTAADGMLRGACRDFTRDAGTPWLWEQVYGSGSGR